MFTGVSGSGKSSLVFGTIAAESQRLINETYSAFLQGFMPTLARPDVDVLEGLTTAIIVDQERMGADARSTVGTATTPTRCCASFSGTAAAHRAAEQVHVQHRVHQRCRCCDGREGGEKKVERRTSSTGGMCARCARASARSPTSTSPRGTTTRSRSTRAP